MKMVNSALLAVFFVSTAVDLRALENKPPNCEGDETKPKPGLAVEPDEVASLIRQLDHDEFVQREAAGKKLTEMGAIAIPALVAAAKGKSPEASMRAFNIIVRHYKDGEEEAKKTASSVLREMAKSGKSLAARAKQAIEPTRPAPRGEAPFRGRIALKAGAQRRVAISVQNGVKQIDAQEDGRQVKILDDPQKGITVEVTEEKEGKKEAKKYQAGSVAELKEKHPQAHRLYQQYAGNVRANPGNVRIQLKSDSR